LKYGTIPIVRPLAVTDTVEEFSLEQDSVLALSLSSRPSALEETLLKAVDVFMKTRDVAKIDGPRMRRDCGDAPQGVCETL
jgi:glycogen synthase